MAKHGDPANAARRQKKYRPMRPWERLGAAAAIVLGLCLCAWMLLGTRIFPYEYTDPSGIVVTTRISLLEKLRLWRPFAGQEGTLTSKEYSYPIRSEADRNDSKPFDDGLDLQQIREGQFTVLFLGLDELRSNTDVIMLAMFDIAGNTVNVLQIPRDTYVPDYTSFSGGKINSVYTLGNAAVSPVQRVVDCVEETFCIPIDRYIITGCEDIAEIVDLIGGVPIDMPYTIHYEPGKTIFAGKQTLHGRQAEWMVRYRHGYSEGDIGRMQAQRIFLAALMQKACGMHTLTLMRHADTIIEKQLIASDLSVDEIRKLSDFAQSIGMERISMYMLPGEAVNHKPRPSGDVYSVWSIHYEPAVDLLNARFRPYYEPIFQLPVRELVTKGNYQNTTYDNESTDLGSILGGDTFGGA